MREIGGLPHSSNFSALGSDVVGDLLTRKMLEIAVTGISMFVWMRDPRTAG